jgi:thiamine pyrophosphate-dependent acetolactate synthase large subunit-like protein
MGRKAARLAAVVKASSTTMAFFGNETPAAFRAAYAEALAAREPLLLEVIIDGSV